MMETLHLRLPEINNSTTNEKELVVFLMGNYACNHVDEVTFNLQPLHKTLQRLQSHHT